MNHILIVSVNRKPFDTSRRRNRIEFYSCVATRPNPIEKTTTMTSGRDASRAIYVYCEPSLSVNTSFPTLVQLHICGCGY